MKQTVIKNPGWWSRRSGMERSLLYVTMASTLAIIALVATLSWCVVSHRLALDTKRSHPGALLHGMMVSELHVYVVLAVGLVLAGAGDNATSAPTLPPLPSALAGDDADSKKQSVNDADEICLTPSCVVAAASVIQAMDTKVEPCDDFYAYACGEYLRKTSIPDDKTSVNIFTQINDQLQQQLRTIIEEPLMESDNRPVKLLKGVYAACMNKTLIEERGLEPVKRILNELHGWPVLDGDSWDPSKFDWKQYVYRLREIGQSVDFFIDFSVGTDAKNSTYRTINLDTASLGLSREYLVKGMDDKLVKAYYDYQVDIAVLYGADRERAKKELRESLDFEIALANISLPSEKRRNVTLLYNPMTIEEMQTEFPSIPWIEYINRILPKDVQVTKDEVIVVSVPSYIKQLESLLSTTEKRVQANYALWRIAGGLVSYLTQELRDRQLKYSTTLTGKLQEDPRWKMCTDLVANGVSLSLGSLYVTKFFNEDSKKAAMEMVTDIRQTFQQMLLKVDWMDEKTKQRALDKAKSMSVHIAYPDELLDLSKLEKFYANLEISSQLYLETILNLTKFGADYSFGRLRLPVNKTEWITHGRPAVVNAYYSSIENSIQFPAGILQGNFFSSERPKYMNYGAIGFVIGHEITHGFDDQGRQFDKNGNLIDWWEPETKEKFLAKATCIINQYGNFTDKSTGLHLNGINTQGENIADNGGIKEAYLAYTAWSERQKQPEPRLPGLASLSPRQMFWVSAAQTWCTKHRPEAMRQRITTGVHSPGEFRVLGPLSNMPDFARDFRCPSGSKMNPISKCQVW